MSRMMSSFRPRGAASASMSVTKPHLYSRLASSSIVRVAVVILATLSLIVGQLQGNERRRHHLQDGLGQPRTQQLCHSAFVLQQVGQRDLAQRLAHPLIERLPQLAQSARAVMDTNT